MTKLYIIVVPEEAAQNPASTSTPTESTVISTFTQPTNPPTEPPVQVKLFGLVNPNSFTFD